MLVGPGCAAPRPGSVPFVPSSAPSTRSADVPARRLTPQPWPFIQDSTGTFGTAHPVLTRESAPDGRWALLDQARADTDGDGKVLIGFGLDGSFGDARTLYFVDGGGPGTPIDHFVHSDESRRFVVMVLRGRLVLADTVQRSVYDLGPGFVDPKWREKLRQLYFSALPRVAHWMVEPVATFDARGAHLATVSSNDGKALVQLVDLRTFEVRTVPLGDGLLSHATLDRDGEWLVTEAVLSDTNGNGFLDLPSEREKPDEKCRRRSANLRTACGGDALIAKIASTRTGVLEVVPRFAGVVGRRVLTKTPDGALVDESGAVRSSATCDAEILFADGTTDTVLVACASEAKRWVENGIQHDSRGPVQILGRIDLPLEASWDSLPVESGGTLSISGEGHAVLYDLVRKRWSEPERESVTVHWGRFAVVHSRVKERNTGSIFDMTTGAHQPLPPGRYYGGANLVTALPMVSISGVAVDLSSGSLMGCWLRNVHAVRLDGSALVARGPAEPDFADVGPLEWQRPLPLDRCTGAAPSRQ